MKLRVLLSICLFCLSQFALADMPPKPEACPSLSSLKTQPFFMAQQPEDAPGFVAISLGKYHTQDNWAFLMAFIEADDMFQAILIANQNLPNITGTPKPMPIEDQGLWACVYGVQGTPYQAIAVTPLTAPNQAAKLMRRI